MSLRQDAVVAMMAAHTHAVPSIMMFGQEKKATEAARGGEQRTHHERALSAATLQCRAERAETADHQFGERR